MTEITDLHDHVRHPLLLDVVARAQKAVDCEWRGERGGEGVERGGGGRRS